MKLKISDIGTYRTHLISSILPTSLPHHQQVSISGVNAMSAFLSLFFFFFWNAGIFFFSFLYGILLSLGVSSFFSVKILTSYIFFQFLVSYMVYSKKSHIEVGSWFITQYILIYILIYDVLLLKCINSYCVIFNSYRSF